MAKKKRRRRPSGARPQQSSAQQPAPPARTSAAQAARRDRREEAKLARQTALRRYRRQRIIRRALVWGGAGLAVLLVAFYFMNQGSKGSGHLSRAGTRAASAAGCTGVESPTDQGREHLDAGAAFTYDQQPPTSGPHDPSPLAAGVYDTAQPETQMVHSLEHGAVEVYYEASGVAELPPDVVDAIGTVLAGKKAILTPAPQQLSPPLDDSGFTVSVAFAAWDNLIQCPNTITADQATTLTTAFANGFIDAGDAPEAGRAI